MSIKEKIFEKVNELPDKFELDDFLEELYLLKG
jgi:hypothetical protein